MMVEEEAVGKAAREIHSVVSCKPLSAVSLFKTLKLLFQRAHVADDMSVSKVITPQSPLTPFKSAEKERLGFLELSLASQVFADLAVPGSGGRMCTFSCAAL